MCVPLITPSKVRARPNTHARVHCFHVKQPNRRQPHVWDNNNNNNIIISLLLWCFHRTVARSFAAVPGSCFCLRFNFCYLFIFLPTTEPRILPTWEKTNFSHDGNETSSVSSFIYCITQSTFYLFEQVCTHTNESTVTFCLIPKIMGCADYKYYNCKRKPPHQCWYVTTFLTQCVYMYIPYTFVFLSGS